MRRVVLIALVLAGCAPTGRVGNEARTQTLSVAVSPTETYTAAAHLAAEWDWTITANDSGTRVLQAETPGNMGRWNDQVTVTVAPAGEGSLITVRSGLSNGPNVRYIQGYLDALRQRVAQ